MIVWKLGGMFWQIERRFLGESPKKRRCISENDLKNKEDFEDEIFSRKISEHVECTFENSARKILSRNFLAEKLKKKTKGETSRSQEELSKKLKELSEKTSTPNFFWTLRSSFDKLGASFSARSAKGFQSESANKTKESSSSRSLFSSKLSCWHIQCCSYRLAPKFSQKLENFLLKIQKRLVKNPLFYQNNLLGW